ncbi:MAG: hypothetical protein EA352_03920 [Gemmatimonadales bacterium]|nr:MAG: hypothetical protein EA352_03920 [Gemmatimonadales bacterium]
MILEEFGGARGIALWRQLRSILSWVRADGPNERRSLTSLERTRARRRLLEPLEGPLPASLLEALLHLPPGPAARPPSEIADACEAVAAWAEEQCGLHTALEYRQAAALLEPDSAPRALAMFASARALAQFSRAEAWFHRVVGLSRRSSDWQVYIEAYLAHGTMVLRMGRLDQARRSFLKALRRSRREGLHLQAGISLQRLLVADYRDGREDRGDERGAQVLERLEDEPSHLRELAEELAFAWLDHGDHAPAARLLDGLTERRIRPGRSGITGSLARARATLGDREGFRDARLRLERLPDDLELASAWLDVAWGAVLLGDDDAMEDALARACTVARHRWYGWIRRGAESVRRARTGELPAPELPAPAPARTERRMELARRILDALEGDSGPERKMGRVSSGPVPPPTRRPGPGSDPHSRAPCG